jgi:acyl-CoA synthetase (AMP-forming)/AMP-acid ligase II
MINTWLENTAAFISNHTSMVMDAADLSFTIVMLAVLIAGAIVVKIKGDTFF